jgi:hypothetical protein
MKLLMIILEAGHAEDLEAFLDRCGVTGYTEVAPVRGRGRSGPRLGSGAFPRTSALVFTMVDDETLGELEAGLDGFCGECGERPRLITWTADEVA